MTQPSQPLPKLTKHVILSLFAFVFIASSMLSTAGEQPWFKESQESQAGAFLVTLDSGKSAPSINEFHNWNLIVTDKSTGESVVPARITVGGGMAAHGHGLPTQPQVTEHLGDGQYQLEGINFNMLGKWTLEFEIASAEVTDRVVFEVVLDI